MDIYLLKYNLTLRQINSFMFWHFGTIFECYLHSCINDRRFNAIIFEA